MTLKEKKWLDALKAEFSTPIQEPVQEPAQEIIPSPIPIPIQKPQLIHKAVKPEPTHSVAKVAVQKPAKKKRRNSYSWDDGAVINLCTAIVSGRFRYYLSVYRLALKGDKEMIAEVLRLRDDVLEDEFMHAYANYINADVSEILEYLEKKL